MRKNLNIMYLTALLQGMVFYAPIATLYRTAVGVTISQIAVIESISLILSLIFELPWGILADRIGYKKTIIICNLLYVISKLIFWKSNGLFGFLSERIILAIVISGFSGVDVSILYMSFPPNRAQRVFGIYNALGTAGLITSSLIYSVFIGDNYRLAGALTVLSYGFALLASFGLKEVKSVKSPPFSATQMLKSLKTAFTNKKLILFLLASALFTQIHQSATVFFSQLKLSSLGASTQVIGSIHIAITVTGLISAFSESIVRKHAAKAPIILTVFAAFACLVLAYTPHITFSVLALILIEGSFSIFSPLQTALENQLTVTKDRATALSINNIITDSTAAGLSVILGFAAEKNLYTSFLLCTLLCITSAVLIKISNKRTL